MELIGKEFYQYSRPKGKLRMFDEEANDASNEMTGQEQFRSQTFLVTVDAQARNRKAQRDLQKSS